jgi:hypothetical protein
MEYKKVPEGFLRAPCSSLEKGGSEEYGSLPPATHALEKIEQIKIVIIKYKKTIIILYIRNINMVDTFQLCRGELSNGFRI